MANEKQRVKEIKTMIQAATLAIPRERESAAMYTKAAQNAPGELSKRLFERLAQDEQMHEAKLKAIIDFLREELARIERGEPPTDQIPE